MLDWLERSHLGHYSWFYGFWLAEGYLRRGEPLRAGALVEDILGDEPQKVGTARKELAERLLGESQLPTTRGRRRSTWTPRATF